MRFVRRWAAPAVGVALVLGGAAVAPLPASQADTGASAVSHEGKKHHHQVKVLDHFIPHGGVRFNEPYNRVYKSYHIRREIIRTIDSMRPGTRIRISAWNVHSYIYTHALILAHQRGVSVRVLMDHANAFPGYPNPDVNRLQAALKKGNQGRPADMTSWLRKCYRSCRGTRGIPHSKFFLFNSVGRPSKNKPGKKRKGVKWVSMYGSNNATDLAANVQWNDLYTFVDHQEVYNEFHTIFRQMSRDKKVKGGAFREYPHHNFTLYFYPYTGPEAEKQGDPDLRILNKIRCTGATGGAGDHGHTVVRLAQDAILGERGIAIAHRLVTMARRGCEIGIAYSLLGGNVKQVLRTGPIRLTHLAYDANEDLLYDHYLHMKTMAVSGVYAGKTNAWLTLNGSANWSPVALASDEVVGVFLRKKLTQKYLRWINWLLTHRPPWWRPDGMNIAPRTMVTTDGRTVKIDPYQLIRQDP